MSSDLIAINARSLTSTAEVRYSNDLMERLHTSTAPTCTTPTPVSVVDAFTMNQTAHLDSSRGYALRYLGTGILTTPSYEPHRYLLTSIVKIEVTLCRNSCSYDATAQKALWTGRNLCMHGLLQAYLGTSRILNSIKSFVLTKLQEFFESFLSTATDVEL